jgi:hypothetical protein
LSIAKGAISMIFIGNFLVLTNQEKIAENERRHGDFNLMIEAPNAAEAIRSFRDAILNFQEQSDFFEGHCKLFLIQLLEFDQMPNQRAMMLSYNSTIGDPVMPYIGCLFPNSDTDGCRFYDWKDNQPQIDGRPEGFFMELKGDDVIVSKALPTTSDVT